MSPWGSQSGHRCSQGWMPSAGPWPLEKPPLHPLWDTVALATRSPRSENLGTGKQPRPSHSAKHRGLKREAGLPQKVTGSPQSAHPRRVRGGQLRTPDGDAAEELSTRPPNVRDPIHSHRQSKHHGACLPGGAGPTDANTQVTQRNGWQEPSPQEATGERVGEPGLR